MEQSVHLANSTGDVLQKVRYTHEAMIDLIVTQPMISQNELAAYFGYTPAWISQVVRSDAFRELLAAKKLEVVGPLFMQMTERMEGLAHRSMDVLMEKLGVNGGSAEVALKALDITSRAMGYGVKQQATNTQINFVVAMPQKSADGEEWQRDYQPSRSGGGALHASGGGLHGGGLHAPLPVITIDTQV